MLFNSLDFGIFLPIVFILYWFVFNKKTTYQNGFIVFVSYIFYGWWDWRFCGLILLSTFIDYFVAQRLSRSESKANRKLWLLISLAVNLGILGFFKYFNFFVENFAEAFSFFGFQFTADRLDIILPVGISFYTFQTLSYTIDVYRNQLKPCSHPLEFAAYVSFFPQMVAGPIERATNLLPQFGIKREFEYASAIDGCRQILWGLFKKVLIADQCAKYVSIIFENHEQLSSSTLVLGAILFSFQIYGDFSGYSDIAIGTSRLFGFNLMKNFAYPYFSRDIAEFWRRWHISLSTWFRDYIYIPLGGSRGNQTKVIRNTLVIFILSGFWHGANWTYIFWGLINALLIIPSVVLKTNRKNLNIVAENGSLMSFKEFTQIVITFALATFAWIFFRSENITSAFSFIQGIFTKSILQVPSVKEGLVGLIPVLVSIPLLLIIEWSSRNHEFGLQKFALKWHYSLRWSFYGLLALWILFYSGKQEAFIYFQF